MKFGSIDREWENRISNKKRKVIENDIKKQELKVKELDTSVKQIRPFRTKASSGHQSESLPARLWRVEDGHTWGIKSSMVLKQKPSWKKQ